jgi:hypothetical protein
LGVAGALDSINLGLTWFYISINIINIIIKFEKNILLLLKKNNRFDLKDKMKNYRRRRCCCYSSYYY